MYTILQKISLATVILPSVILCHGPIDLHLPTGKDIEFEMQMHDRHERKNHPECFIDGMDVRKDPNKEKNAAAANEATEKWEQAERDRIYDACDAVNYPSLKGRA